MKNSEEMVNSLLERRDRYVAEQKRKRTRLLRAAASVCCLAVLAVFGMWHGGMFDTTPHVSLNDSVCIGEKDYFGPDEWDADADTQTSKNDADLSDDSSAANDTAGDHSDNSGPNGSEKTVISSFITNGTPSAEYAAPENGKFYFSTPLREAMNEYGDRVLYRVVVDVFNNKDQLSPGSSQVQDECERLSNIGYVAAYETVSDGEAYHYYITLHATYDELTEFAVNESYGYFMFLYGERVESADGSPISY